MESFEIGEVLFADTASQKDKLWFLRRRVGEAVKAASTYKEEDTVVPRYELPRLLTYVKDLGDEYGFKSICYGHAGDGNLHINILKGELFKSSFYLENVYPIGIVMPFHELLKYHYIDNVNIESTEVL